MIELFLVRHGENLANLTKEFSHHRVDYPLTPKGVQQAQQTGAWFAANPPDAIFTSPLKRAHQTALHIQQHTGAPLFVQEELREVNTGDLENRPPTAENWAIHNAVIAAWLTGDLHRHFPDGESYHELRERFFDGLRAITAGRDGQKIALVAHGGIITFTLPDLCPGLDRRELAENASHNCSITRVLLNPASHPLRGELIEFGFCGHLSGEAANVVLGIPDDTFFDEHGNLKNDGR